MEKEDPLEGLQGDSLGLMVRGIIRVDREVDYQ